MKNIPVSISRHKRENNAVKEEIQQYHIFLPDEVLCTK